MSPSTTAMMVHTWEILRTSIRTSALLSVEPDPLDAHLSHISSHISKEVILLWVGVSLK